MCRAGYGTLKEERQSKEYRAWQNLRNRCNNKKYYLFHRYGGRGIKVCCRWDSYNNFISDMGRAPSKNHSIDRVDNDLGYNPDNCKWSTYIEQANNRINNNKIEIDGEIKSLAEWCRSYGMDYSVASRRICLGWDKVKALTSPVGCKTYKYITPDGEFESQYDVAEHYGMKVKTVSARFCSKTVDSWNKIPI